MGRGDRGRRPSAGPQRDPFSLVLSPSHQPFSPHRGTLSPPLRSFVSGHLAAPSSLAPAWAALPLASLFGWRGSPCLPYPLSALARSPPAPHVRTAAGRGGREGGSAADGSERVDLVLAATRRKLSPPLFNYSSAPRSRAPSPAFGPFLSLYVGGGYFTSPVCPASEVAFPLPCTPLPFGFPHVTFCPLPPQPPPWRWLGRCRWGRPRSAGTIALHQPGQAQGSGPG